LGVVGWEGLLAKMHRGVSVKKHDRWACKWASYDVVVGRTQGHISNNNGEICNDTANNDGEFVTTPP
jgi:hypothetical protein